MGTPAVGDWDGDGTVEVAQVRREGVLTVWRTPSRTPAQWASWNCDDANTGACVEPAAVNPPEGPTTTSPTSVAPVTTAAPVGPPTSAAPAVDRRGDVAVDLAGGRPAGADTLAADSGRRGLLPVTGSRLGDGLVLAVALLGVGLIVETARRRRVNA